MMASRFPRAITARVQPVRGRGGLLPRASTSFSHPRRLIPLSVQSPACVSFSTKSDPNSNPTVSSLPTAAAAAVQNSEAAAHPPSQDEPELIHRELVENRLGPAHTIKDALELYRLPSWGFVLFRCTYKSQEKWDKFVAIVQNQARACVKEDETEPGMLDEVHARMRWTVIEDPATLDGADIVETSRRFVEWMERGPGGRELAGSVYEPLWARYGMSGCGTARHLFFLHVDEESLESVVDEAKAKEKGGYFCTMVRPGFVVLNKIEWDWEKGVYFNSMDGEELEQDEMADMRKRVRIDDLVCLYAKLHVSPDVWYYLEWFDGNVFLPF